MGHLFLAMVLIGCAVRLAVAFATYGERFDIGSFRFTDIALRAHGFNAYSAANIYSDAGVFSWPYLAGGMPLLLLSGELTRVLGLPFHGIFQIWPILADVGIAWLVQAYLANRGATERTRLAAAALVIAGPSFAVVSGFHGQFDSVAILPAVAALYVWDRMEAGARRAVVAGVLIGVGIALKTAPGLMLFALLPACRSWREGLQLLAGAASIPVITVLPFLISDPSGVAEIANYQGVPGQGGLSLLAHPSLVGYWIHGDPLAFNGLSSWLTDHAAIVVGIPLAITAVLLFRHRPPPALAASLLWLCFFAFSPNLLLNYAIWGLPFFLMAGYVREVLAIQVLLLVPTVIRYGATLEGPWDAGAVVGIYATFMAAVTVSALAGFGLLARRVHALPASRQPART
jgi:hypothetical protein